MGPEAQRGSSLGQRGGDPKKAKSGMMSSSKETPALPDFLEITLKIEEIILGIIFLPSVGVSSLQPRGMGSCSSKIRISSPKIRTSAQNAIALFLQSVFEEGSQRSLIKIPFFIFLNSLDISPSLSWMLRFTGNENQTSSLAPQPIC